MMFGGTIIKYSRYFSACLLRKGVNTLLLRGFLMSQYLMGKFKCQNCPHLSMTPHFNACKFRWELQKLFFLIIEVATLTNDTIISPQNNKIMTKLYKKVFFMKLLMKFLFVFSCDRKEFMMKYVFRKIYK